MRAAPANTPPDLASASSIEPPAPRPLIDGGTSPADPAELARIVGEIKRDGERSSEAAASPAAAAEAEQDLLDRAERFASDPAALAKLEGMTEEEIADLLELGFGLVAEFRGPHWEIHQRAARRVAKWGKKSLDRHGWEWAAKWLPDVMAVALLAFEIGKRVREDRAVKLAKDIKARVAQVVPGSSSVAAGHTSTREST